MSKRPHPDSRDGAGNLPPRKRLNQGRIDGVVSSSRTKLHRALKLAKGFERQKLSRRLKAARQEKDEKQLGRISAEIEAWKTLDAGQIANGYLSRIVSRDKLLSQVTELVESATTPPRPAGDAASTNVTARLYNAKPVKDAVRDITAQLYAATNLSKSSSAKGNASTQAANAREVRMSSDVPSRTESIDEDDKSAVRPTSNGQQHAAKATAQEGIDELALSDLSDMEEQFRSRIASDSDEEQSESRLEARHHELERSDDVWSGSESELGQQQSEGSFESFDPPGDGGKATNGKVVKSRATKTKDLAAPKETEKYVPSLSNFGYISGSDSDASDAESLSDAAPARGNRRGQRARQKIWEQKYGTGAKHLQKPKKGQRDRDQDWDTKRGARGPREPRKRDNGRSNRQATGANMESVNNRLADSQVPTRPPRPKRDDTGSLHPSWIAKKMAKEKEAQMSAPFQGTKVTFD